MENRSLADEIIAIVQSQSNNNPPPLIVKITKTYSNNRVDLEYDGVKMRNISCSSNCKVGDEGVLIFINGDSKQPYCIVSGADLSDYYTREEVDQIVVGGGIDLSDYMKKEDYVVDSSLNNISSNPVQNKKILEYLENMTLSWIKITDKPFTDIDATLSPSSINPVQNKIIKENLDLLSSRVNDVANRPKIISVSENEFNPQSIEYTGNMNDMYIVKSSNQYKIYQWVRTMQPGTADFTYNLNLVCLIPFDIGHEVTSFELVPKSDDSNGKIIIYYGDEPNP